MINFFKQRRTVLIIYVITAIIVTTFKYFGPVEERDGVTQTRYNNYLIFKSSFIHLVENKNLYQLHPEDHFDYFKYSPSFALIMFPFAFLPNILGLTIWNFLNVVVIFFAIRAIPNVHDQTKIFILWYVFLEIIISIQNAQSNGIMTALIIFAFVSFENRNVIIASLCLVLSIYLKLFGIVAFILALLYQKKMKFLLFSLIWTVLIGLIPLIVVSPQQLLYLNSKWFDLLWQDQLVSHGQSLMGFLYSWFNLTIPNFFVLIFGIIVLTIPLIRRDLYPNYRYRLIFLASILIWIVIFNHKAESPTYIIAMTGIAIWIFTQDKTSLIIFYACFALIMTSIASTDIFPRFIRNEFIIPYMFKALPSIIISLKISYDLFRKKIQVNTNC
jgi:hypothetical protein